jgi:hypothetical protein
VHLLLCLLIASLAVAGPAAALQGKPSETIQMLRDHLLLLLLLLLLGCLVAAAGQQQQQHQLLLLL